MRKYVIILLKNVYACQNKFQHTPTHSLGPRLIACIILHMIKTVIGSQSEILVLTVFITVTHPALLYSLGTLTSTASFLGWYRNRYEGFPMTSDSAGFG